MEQSQQAISPTRYRIETLSIAVIYIFLGEIGTLVAITEGNASPVWPPSGFSLAVMLLLGNRAWFGIFLGAFFSDMLAYSNLLTSENIIASLAVSISVGLGSVLQPLVGSTLIKYFIDPSRLLHNIVNFIKFLLIIPFISLISASIGITAAYYGGFISADIVQESWLTWWLGDSVGILFITPLILLWSHKQKLHMSKKKLFKLGIIYMLIAFSGFITFGPLSESMSEIYHLEYLAWPILLWLAVHYYRHFVMIGVLILTVIAIVYTVSGYGPFKLDNFNHSLLLLQLFIAVIYITIMLITILVYESKQGDYKLHQSMDRLAMLNLELELRVKERTKDLEKAKSMAEKLARTDFLTNLNNRMAFSEYAKVIENNSRRFEHPYVIAMIDIDNFKKINDTWGHDVGDKAIKAVADIITKISRKVDIIGRIGGEEFAIIMPETTLDTSEKLLERIRENIENEHITISGNTVRLTISIGMDEFDGDVSFEKIMSNADEALYEAKNNGRNNIKIYGS